MSRRGGDEGKGVDAEIIDLRTLMPLDIETIEASVGEDRTLHDRARGDPHVAALARSLSALVQERCFYHLEAPIERVTGFDTPYPHASNGPISRARSGSADAIAARMEG